MEETKKIQNLVSLTGVVVNMYDTYACRVATIAISMPVRGKDGNFRVETNYPKVYFFNTDPTGIKDIEKGMSVNVIGHIVAPKKTRPETGKTYYSQSIIGDKISENKTALAEAGVGNGHRSSDAENSVYLEGVVERIERVTENVAIFTIAAYNKRFYNKVKVTCFDNRCVAITPGNTVSINAYVSTPMKVDADGVKKKHQNIVAYSIKDLGKLPVAVEKRDYKAEKQAAIKESYETQPIEAV